MRRSKVLFINEADFLLYANEYNDFVMDLQLTIEANTLDLPLEELDSLTEIEEKLNKYIEKRSGKSIEEHTYFKYPNNLNVLLMRYSLDILRHEIDLSTKMFEIMNTSLAYDQTFSPQNELFEKCLHQTFAKIAETTIAEENITKIDNPIERIVALSTREDVERVLSKMHSYHLYYYEWEKFALQLEKVDNSPKASIIAKAFLTNYDTVIDTKQILTQYQPTKSSFITTYVEKIIEEYTGGFLNVNLHNWRHSPTAIADHLLASEHAHEFNDYLQDILHNKYAAVAKELKLFSDGGPNLIPLFNKDGSVKTLAHFRDEYPSSPEEETK